MKMNTVKITLFVCFSAFATLFVSCDKEAVTESDIAAYVDQTEEDIQLQTRSGGGQCFELVWPITIAFPDSSTAEVNSREELKETILAWRTDNPDVPGRAKIAFPFEVITADGEVVSIDSKLELLQLKRECKDRPNFGDKRPCFKLNVPVSVEFPDGNVVTFETRKALVLALRKWKKNHTPADPHPHLVYPITITMKDGTVVEVASPEELAAIKEDCGN